ncbi:MAG: 16S rRNA (cytosine(1402)-N(4))-methyltransferase [Candidatus Levybacteria bacterium RIFCSPHIGHO2_12_FULL_38_12]|nr:MAG: 16S rRNA (cytosine(1402)-N(4))-methyltransferase [Candidatus Levybacteria bacterium RIFCSPHIGHO2_01_FULL_38_12]OGH22546.1 MAG: 16S rRNA (cytosine(1402)-N(4))-methyltransferase [Candidatus Levybacteria bacterium RIFCSPHIGHO2_12_FULL_38_12]OGH33418.1 MAG: 16S rRNA (cytosine(1402)-N(4))-methyltransferase [Candidatus Levybacteria bacterium RIFCSPLOWO2_01_FULL_37_20]OGH44083.1 MAG: 16S rRNA (cytosine(1402)-N(4))-methyltransferase [Candidatus Levybacteria bacterium RIFCSPLOWO2_02_FULL_37_18]
MKAVNKNFHTPVLVEEVIRFLNVQDNKKYIDATLGGGGHSFEILRRGGSILGIDVDEEALDFVREKLKTQSSNLKTEGQLRVVKGNFKDVKAIAKENGFENVDGILFDLGVSSHQLDTPRRGFSFGKNGPLDMRMDKNLSVTAKDLVNALRKGELYELFSKLGQEYRARVISESIISARRLEKIETTGQLAEIVKRSLKGITKTHPATRVFQALRIAVNDELNNLREALSSSIGLLGNKGRLVVITFHSLEDGIVKQNFKEFEEKGSGTIIIKKPVEPTPEEVRSNIRSRSAKLRAFEKLM